MLGDGAQSQRTCLSASNPIRPLEIELGADSGETGSWPGEAMMSEDDSLQQDEGGLFVPMHDEAPLAPQSAHEEQVLVSSTLGPMRISSSMGFFVPRNASAASSSASSICRSASGSSSLRVSTSSFCSSHETLVDGDSDYRSTHRPERRKLFPDEIGSVVAIAAASAAAATATAGHDAPIFSRATAPEATRAALPPCPLPSGRQPYTPPSKHDALEHRTNHQRDSCEMATQTGDLDLPTNVGDSAVNLSHCLFTVAEDHERLRIQAKEARRARRRETRGERVRQEDCERQYYPEDLCPGAKATPQQASEAADAWRKKFGVSSLLMPTDGYDYTVQLALLKIQQYR